MHRYGKCILGDGIFFNLNFFREKIPRPEADN